MLGTLPYPTLPQPSQSNPTPSPSHPNHPHFRLPLPIQMFIKVASSPRLSGIGMPSPIPWSHPLKMQRIVLLSSLLWWELGTNSLITGPGEWLSFRRFTSKLSWSWFHPIQPNPTPPALYADVRTKTNNQGIRWYQFYLYRFVNNAYFLRNSFFVIFLWYIPNMFPQKTSSVLITSHLSSEQISSNFITPEFVLLPFF